MSADIDTIVVGAGVVGLAIARAVALKGRETMVLERHELIGSEISSRNSEVVHAGLYYPPGSLKAALCVAGKRALYRFCVENGVAYRRCEKLLVATAEDQLVKLKTLSETAFRNGVDDLVYLSPPEVRRIEPAVRCIAALLSPSTGVIDSHGLMLALQGHAEANGAQIVLHSPVESIEVRASNLFAVKTGGENTGVVTCRCLVLAAGLHGSVLARTLAYGNRYTPPETYYGKGQYYALEGRSPFARHIYPMPQGAWLGLHATVDLSGRCKFGPDLEWVPEIDYGFDERKLEPSLSFIRSYYPDLKADRLHPDYTGIRPKLYREGEPAPDFAVHTASEHGHPGLVMLFGIESPGLTAALAIGDYVTDVLHTQHRS
ncbi:MAG: NAD(P)/FAD-dependent oxidoreductase [Hyphomicrobiaceae bacterium]